MVSMKEQMEKLAHYTGERCARFRNDILQLNLTDFCNCTGANLKNVWAFENGKANNIKYLFYYYNMCVTQHEQERFTDYVFRGY